MKQVWQIIKLCSYFMKAIFQYFSSTKTPLSNFFYVYSIRENVLIKELIEDYERLKKVTFAPPEYDVIYRQLHAEAYEQVRLEIRDERQVWEQEKAAARHLEERQLNEMRIEALNKIEELKSSELARFHHEMEIQKEEVQSSFDQLNRGWQELEAAKERQQQYQIHAADLVLIEDKIKNLKHIEYNLDQAHDQLQERLQGLMRQQENLGQKLKQIIDVSFDSFKLARNQLSATNAQNQLLDKLLVVHTDQASEQLSQYAQSLELLNETEAFETFKTLSEAEFVHHDFALCTPVRIDYAPLRIKEQLDREAGDLSHYGLDYVRKAIWLSTINAWTQQLDVTIENLHGEEEYLGLWNELFGKSVKQSSHVRPVTMVLVYDLTPQEVQRIEQIQGDLLLGLGAQGAYSEEDLNSLFVHYQVRHQLNRLPLFFLGERHEL